MIENLINQLVTVSFGLAILAGSYLVWLLSGIARVMFTADLKWSWKRMLEDLVKTILISIAIISWVVVFNFLDWFAGKAGLDISQMTDGANVLGLVGGIIGGSIYYLVKGYKNFYNFINSEHIEVPVEKMDYKAVYDAVISTIIKQDEGDNEYIDASTKQPEYGYFPYYYVDINTPESFYQSVNGVGFNEGYGLQCVAGFKEFMYCLSGQVISTSTGGASGYAKQQSQIEPLGFTWHNGTSGLQNGDWGIFGNGQYGHVAMYLNGKWFGQNQNSKDPYIGSPFSLCTIPSSELIGYYRPNIYRSEPAQPDKKDTKDDSITYTVKSGDTFGQIILDLGLATNHGLWGSDGDVKYYADQNGISNPNIIFPNETFTFRKRS